MFTHLNGYVAECDLLPKQLAKYNSRLQGIKQPILVHVLIYPFVPITVYSFMIDGEQNIATTHICMRLSTIETVTRPNATTKGYSRRKPPPSIQVIVYM